MVELLTVLSPLCKCEHVCFNKAKNEGEVCSKQRKFHTFCRAICQSGRETEVQAHVLNIVLFFSRKDGGGRVQESLRQDTAKFDQTWVLGPVACSCAKRVMYSVTWRGHHACKEKPLHCRPSLLLGLFSSELRTNVHKH